MESPPQPAVAAAPVAAGPTAADEARVAQAKILWEQAFRKHIKKYQKYPKSAKRKNQQGSPVVEFVFDRQGNVLEARIARSSGFAALDEAAISTFERASPLPPIPPEIEADRLKYPVRLDFILTN
ncbi:MAG: energy transducer TonB [Rhodospirillaceae bacterium]|nr:energy transducer TonB [Rhodospirillaceae bacterium]